MNLFIDTNVFLSFYHLTSDDLEELHKLIVLLEKKEVVLWLPQQIVDEYYRNREVKIADALKRLKDQKIKGQYPAFCKDYPQYATLRDHLKEYDKTLTSLVNKVTEDITSNSLNADKVIDDLFEKAEYIETSSELIAAARDRMDIGNPPGKNKSLGDAINWETLLSNIPDKEDLYLVADDKDYFSVLEENEPKEFLIQEWDGLKQGELHVYRRLSQFFKEHYPDIKLASELEKEFQIKSLVNSSNFAQTHSAVSKLSKHTHFSEAQLLSLMDAAVQNSQVNWILTDSDVRDFYSSLIEQFNEKIPDELLGKVTEELENSDISATAIDDDDLPF